MQNYENQSKPKRIYLKATRQWVEVTEEYYRDHTRHYDALRKRQQSHGQCVCPKNKFWLCDGDCLVCKFHRAGDMHSLDFTVENEDGDACSPLDAIPHGCAAPESKSRKVIPARPRRSRTRF